MDLPTSMPLHPARYRSPELICHAPPAAASAGGVAQAARNRSRSRQDRKHDQQTALAMDRRRPAHPHKGVRGRIVVKVRYNREFARKTHEISAIVTRPYGTGRLRNPVNMAFAREDVADSSARCCCCRYVRIKSDRGEGRGARSRRPGVRGRQAVLLYLLRWNLLAWAASLPTAVVGTSGLACGEGDSATCRDAGGSRARCASVGHDHAACR